MNSPLLLQPCLRRVRLNISVDWKYFQSVVLKTTDDSFSGQQLRKFRLEGYREEQTNYSQLIFCHSLFRAFQVNSNIFLEDWSLDNTLLTLDLESKSRGTLWGPIMTIPTSAQLSTSACEGESVTMWWIVTHSSWHVTTPVTWDDHGQKSLRAVLSGMRNGGRNDEMMMAGHKSSCYFWLPK